MSERQDKSPEQVSDEDYKVAPTSADDQIVGREDPAIRKKGSTATGENYKLPEVEVQEVLKEGVE